jgi:peptidoglycan/LPS O-acetylase OafA/YrhL
LRSQNRAYLPAVDHLRAAAAALVLVYHGSQLLRSDVPGAPAFSVTQWAYSANPLETFIAEGHSGVALFMVLSGFILTTGSLGRQISYRAFMRNRLLRVGPLFGVLLMIAIVAAKDSFSLLGVAQTTLGFGTLPGGFTTGPFALVLWTVGVELQFYLVFPFFLRLLDKHGARPILLFIGCMAVLRTLAALTAPSGFDLNQMTYYSLVGRIDQFLIGMLAAYYFPRLRTLLGHVWAVAAAATAVIAVLWWFNQVHGYADPGVWRTVWVDVEGVAWAALLVSYVGLARTGRGRLSVTLAWLGERSYGLYLLHMPVIYLVAYRGWHLDLGSGAVVDATATALLLVLPVALALATLTFAAVEQPFLSLRRRYVVEEARPPAPLPPRGEDEAAVAQLLASGRVPAMRVGV